MKKPKQISKKDLKDAKEQADKLALSDKAHNRQYAVMFRKLRKMIRNKEKDCLSKDAANRDFYVLNMLYSQMRELINDIRTIVDSSGQAADIVEGILQPASIERAQIITDLYYQLKRTVIENLDSKQAKLTLKKLDGTIQDFAKAFQHVENKTTEKVFDMFVGSTPKSKKR